MNPEKNTLQYYDQHADAFVQSTMNADMNHARERFLQYLPEGAFILDLGCGSGRDAKAFLERGYQVDAVDGSAELCRIAGRLTGIPVRQMFFQDLCAENLYDGIWACASILHLPRCRRRLKSDTRPLLRGKQTAGKGNSNRRKKIIQTTT